MFQMNDIEMMHEHRQALLGEAEGGRLARRLKGVSPKREGSYAGWMRRRVALLLSTIGLAVLLVASAAYALDIQCPASIGGAACIGTEDADSMVGTDGLDTMVGLGGNDTSRGSGAPDRLTGDDELAPAFSVGDGTDTIEGGPGNDTVRAVEGQSDVIDCGPGRDSVEFDAGLDSVKRCEIKEPL